ncbi:neuroblast differentiation-associated protein AHNAK, partial [Tachysurus ichikawai]
MADEEDTREVLFPQWMGPDKHGLTIEQKAHGEIFVTEVKEESPAAHTGRVFEGDQIVGATIYFENMSSTETAELLKTLNRHKVGLKLQHKTGDKSPCRSPMGTLSWEAQTGFGGSSPDIVLSGDDEEYRRIYTKKIKPRLKSEDLAEGVDVRTERHSSTSSDGSTITTITRRITTYTVDIPGGSGQQQIDISSPEFKLNVSEGSSAQIKMPHGSIISRVSGQEALDLGEGRVKDPKGSSEKHWSTEHVKTSFTTEGTEGSGKDLKLNRYDTGLTTAKALGGEGSSELIQYDYSVRGQGSLTSDTQTGYSDLSVTPGIGTDKNLVSNSEQLLKMKREVTISGKEAEKNIESPKVNITGAEESKGGMKMSKISVSSIEIKSPKAKSDADKVLQSEIKAAKMDIKAPGIVDPKLKLTSISGSEINIKSLKAKGEVDVSVPNVEGTIKAPEVDIRHPVVGIEGSDGGIAMPEIIMPSIQLQGPKVKGPNVDASLHKGEVDIKGLNIDMSTDVDIEGHKGKVKGPKVKMPSISGPKISMSAVDVNLKGSNIKSDVDISLAKVEGNIKAPKVDVKVPHVETEGPEGGFKMPKIKMPSYGVIVPKVEELDVDTRLAKAEVHVSVPEVEGDIKAPKVDIRGPQIDTEGPEGGFKMPKIKMPSFSVKGLKGEGPDVNLPEGEVDIKGPSIDVKIPEVDIEGPEGKLKGPKISMPDVDFNLKGPKVKGEVDASFPKLEGEIKTQKVDIKSPDVDIEGPEGKVKGPKFKMPTISGPKISMPDVHIKGPKLKGDVDVSVPKIEGDIKAPKVDIKGPDVDVEGSGGFKMPKMKMPTFGIKGPKVEGPEIEVNLPKADIDVKGISLAKVEGNIKAPKVDVKVPHVETEGPEGGFKMPKIKMPSYGVIVPKVEELDVDTRLAKAEVHVSVPEVEGDIKAPKVDIRGPQIDTEGPEGGFKMPKIKMPSFSVKGLKGEGPDVNLPEGEVDIKGPSIDVKIPEVDIEGPEGKLKGPKISMPDVDFNLKGPKVKGEVDASFPKLEGEIKTQKVDIKSPDVDIEGPEGKVKGPKFKMPTISGPKISMPDVHIKGPKLKGDVDVSVPKIEGDIKAPKVD